MARWDRLTDSGDEREKRGRCRQSVTGPHGALPSLRIGSAGQSPRNPRGGGPAWWRPLPTAGNVMPASNSSKVMSGHFANCRTGGPSGRTRSRAARGPAPYHHEIGYKQGLRNRALPESARGAAGAPVGWSGRGRARPSCSPIGLTSTSSSRWPVGRLASVDLPEQRPLIYTILRFKASSETIG